MLNYSGIITGTLSDVKSPFGQQGSHFINEGFGFLWGMEALEAIVYIKAMLNGLKNLLVAL